MGENAHLVDDVAADEFHFLFQPLVGAGRRAARAISGGARPGGRAWRDGCVAEVAEETSDARPADDLGRRKQPA